MGIIAKASAADLSSRLPDAKKLLTCQQLQSLIGQPLKPCPTCGSAIRHVGQDGSLFCPDCIDAVSLDLPMPTTAMRLMVLDDPKRGHIAADFDAMERDRLRNRAIDAAAYKLDRDGVRWRVVAAIDYPISLADRNRTMDEWFGDVPENIDVGEREWPANQSEDELPVG